MSLSPDGRQIAVAQYAPKLGDVDANLATSLAKIAEAAERGACAVVLPECALTGYAFERREDPLRLAEPLSGPSVEAWRTAAERQGITVVAGMAERDGEELFNTAVAIAPEGAVQAYRKVHLWGCERALYAAGRSLTVFDSPFGRVGLALCYDLWFPEHFRALADLGAELVAVPANWAGNPRLDKQLDRFGLPIGYHMTVAAAVSNELLLAVADRTGTENGKAFLGASCIVGPDGRCLAGPLGQEEDMLLAPIPDVGAIRRTGQSHRASRRAELYSRDPASASARRGRDAGLGCAPQGPERERRT